MAEVYAPNIFSLGGLQGTSGSSIGENWASGNNWGASQGTSAYNAYSDSQYAADAYSINEAISNAYNHTFGREASAQDIANARAANDVEAQFWAMQAAFNAMEAEKNRKYQTEMSNTAYQRAVDDLKKAGLNPMLAVGAQASSPGGSVASSGLASAKKANAYAESIGESSAYAYGKSQSTARSSSHSEAHGTSHNTSKWGGSNSAYGYAQSQYSNNIKELVQSASGIIGGIIESGVGAIEKGMKNYKNNWSDDSILKNQGKEIQNNIRSKYDKNYKGRKA